MSEKIVLAKSLKVGSCVYIKGTVLTPPFPTSININAEINRGTIIYYGSKDNKNDKAETSFVEAEEVKVQKSSKYQSKFNMKKKRKNKSA